MTVFSYVFMVSCPRVFGLLFFGFMFFFKLHCHAESEDPPHEIRLLWYMGMAGGEHGSAHRVRLRSCAQCEASQPDISEKRQQPCTLD